MGKHERNIKNYSQENEREKPSCWLVGKNDEKLQEGRRAENKRKNCSEYFLALNLKWFNQFVN